MSEARRPDGSATRAQERPATDGNQGRSVVSVTRLTPGPRGGMLAVPLRGRVLLRPAALRERLWQAYAYALNTDDEPGPERAGYRPFPEELRALHGTVCGRVVPTPDPSALEAAFAFAGRWRLRRRDVWDTCHSVEMHDRPGQVREDALHLHLPLVLYSAPPELAPVEIAPPTEALVYDLTETTATQVRSEVRRRYNDALRAIARAEDAWVHAGLLIRVPARHADPAELNTLAQRWLRRVKGWTLAEIAEAESAELRSVQSSLRTWRELDRSRAGDDARFKSDA